MLRWDLVCGTHMEFPIKKYTLDWILHCPCSLLASCSMVGSMFRVWNSRACPQLWDGIPIHAHSPRTGSPAMPTAQICPDVLLLPMFKPMGCSKQDSICGFSAINDLFKMKNLYKWMLSYDPVLFT